VRRFKALCGVELGTVARRTQRGVWDGRRVAETRGWVACAGSDGGDSQNMGREGWSEPYHNRPLVVLVDGRGGCSVTHLHDLYIW
jgi:hypothetical protein